ncbi:hypothetical protein HLH36_04915 [Gluconacetobacter aggeris]|uniref:Uncharacterized protein n=1 Tax=Gluconacetobacter aggeris TaxID=1286186 RepID=A0A7W4NYK1_9PROT|nr:hypothetical protein [Gluconacetobacter aggeris]MBB2167700.1 hypothetical protein [Gluconacetobacter aggeris]
MTMRATVTQGPSDLEITVHDTVFKVMHLLDMAGEELAGAQQVVAECMRDTSMTSSEIYRLQKLDLATQTVASVATVLRNLMSLAPTGIADTVSVAHLYEGITLGDVVQVLKGENAPNQPTMAGEIDLF